MDTKVCADTEECLSVLSRALSVFLTTWLPGMRAVDARLASAVSTCMGKVNQQLGTPTPPTPPIHPFLPSGFSFHPLLHFQSLIQRISISAETKKWIVWEDKLVFYEIKALFYLRLECCLGSLTLQLRSHQQTALQENPLTFLLLCGKKSCNVQSAIMQRPLVETLSISSRVLNLLHVVTAFFKKRKSALGCSAEHFWPLILQSVITHRKLGSRGSSTCLSWLTFTLDVFPEYPGASCPLRIFHFFGKCINLSAMEPLFSEYWNVALSYICHWWCCWCLLWLSNGQKMLNSLSLVL